MTWYLYGPKTIANFAGFYALTQALTDGAGDVHVVIFLSESAVV
jgi:hypothetical protein